MNQDTTTEMEVPRNDDRLTGTDESFGESSASESEYQHALEVVLDHEGAHRRKSSLTIADAARTIQERNQQASHSRCIVHSLLQKRRKNGEALEDIREDCFTPDRQSVSEPNGNSHTRHLTKKQLSEMLLGVRDLSKKLSRVCLRLKVKTVFLLTKAQDKSLVPLTRNLAAWLLSKERDTPYIVFVQDTLEHDPLFDAKGLLQTDPTYKGRLQYWDVNLCARHPHTFDFVVTLGGDGTVLYASWLFQRVVPPVLSFALGSLGFLTKFDYGEYEDALTLAFREGIKVSLRIRLEGTVMRSQKRPSLGPKDIVEELIGDEADNNHTHKPEKSFKIMNDIVVDRGPHPTMSSLEFFGDDQHYTTIQADGLCIATPTGSTAYNLAAGGSLCHPENPVILVTAICAHTLSFRPIILPDTMVLRIGVPYDARTSSWVSFDGRERVELMQGDYVTISASRYPFPTVMPQAIKRDEWIEGIQRTLQWNSRRRQKGFQEEADKDNGLRLRS
ncbi:MAG: hypothetical protein M1834_003399 [Cirrosporium novae-zelandiae]|nr:MAG: hypothetical protein M1834_003399 [Cirrosporium novae-zelandiae]